MRVPALAPACGTLLALLAAPATATAQNRFTFDVASAASTFNFSGSVALGAIGGSIVGQPGSFNPSGAFDLDLGIAASTIGSGQFVPSDPTISPPHIVTIPTLNATVPSGIPFVPPLASVTITGTTAVFTSVDATTLAPASFAVGGGGSFSTPMIVTILSGTAMVTSALFGNQNLPLAGAVSSPQTVSGTISVQANGLRVSVPINLTLPFDDPTTGLSGTLNLNGTLVANTRPLSIDVAQVSLGAGGIQNQALAFGSSRAGQAYLVMGSASGTAPGTTLLGVPVPLNFDGFLLQSIQSANTAPFVNTFGALDGIGSGAAGFAIPPLPIPVLVGLPLDFAAVSISGPTITRASNAVPFAFAP